MVEPTPLFDQDFEERVSQAASTRAVEGLDYDQKESARAMQLQRLFGVPAPLIAGDLEGFEREQKTKLVSNMVRSNPAIQDYLNGNPLAARISQDDYPQLDTWHQSMREFVRPPALFDRIESGLKKVGQSFVEGLVSAPLKAGAIVPRQIAEARKEGQDQFASQELPEDASPEERAAFRLRRGQLHQTEQVREERKQAFNEATSKPVEEHPLYKAGQFVEDVAKYLMPEDPRFQDEFLASKVPGALGSIASFIVGGGILATTKAPMAFTTATLGSVQQSVSQFEDAIQHGASIEDALKTAGYGAAIGTSEALPIVHFLERLDKTTGGTLKKAIGRILLQGTEEFTQEFGQKVAENLTANKFVGYDPERGTFTGAMDDASVGFTAGAIMETMAQIIGGKRAKVSAQSVASRIKTANAYLAAGETPPVGLDPFFDLQHAEQAKGDLTAFNQLMSAANKTQTKELSPELAEQFAKQGVGEFKIGIPPEAVLELYGTKQPSADDGLLGFITDLNDQLEIAAQTGGDVQVSLAQLLAHGDSEVIDKIEEHLRIREGGMTAKEAETFKEQQEAQTEEEQIEPQGPTSIDDLARKEAGFDTYASRIRQQVTLQKVDEEIDEDHPDDPPHSVYHILNDQGQKIGDATVQLTAKNMLYVSWIGGYKPNPSFKDVARGTPQVFGLHATMSLFEQLAKEYPTATHIGGYRATGAREKADATGWAQMSLDTFRKDPQKGAEFLASINADIGQQQEEPDLPGTVTTDIPGGGTIKWQPQKLWDTKKAEVWKAISDIAEQIAPGVNLILADKVTSHSTGFDKAQPVHGFFSKENAEPYIVLAYNPKTTGTLLHEVMHHLRRGGFFKPEEWTALEQASKDNGWVEHYDIRRRYPNASEELVLEESIASAYPDWVEEEGATKGKTPSEVAGIFAKLKKFFDQIKIRMQEIFGSDITFQRLFTQVSAGEIGSRQGDQAFAQSAPQAMVAQATQAEEQAMFERAGQFGMTRPQFEKLLNLWEKDRLDSLARETAKAKAKADISKSPEWKAFLPEARDQAELDVNNSNAIRVDEYFRTGKIAGADVEKIRLGTEFLTREQQEALGANIYAKDGANPNDVSWLFGFNSGQAMIHAMASVRSERMKSGLTIAAFKERLIADRQQEIMREKFLGPKMEEELKDAREDILSQTRMDILHEELLSAMLQAKQYDPNLGQPFSKADVKRAANVAFQNLPIKRALKYEQFMKDAGKAGNAAFAAMMKKDYGEALRQKQRQILNVHFAMESKNLGKIQSQVERVAGKFKSREVSNVDHAATVFIKDLLSKAGFRVNRSDQEIQEGKDHFGFASLATFADAKVREGYEITMPDYIKYQEQVKPMEEMTARELAEFRDAVVSMATAARKAEQLLIHDQLVDKAVVRAEILNNIQKGEVRDPDKPKGKIHLRIDAQKTRIEEIAKDLDGRDNPNGPLFNTLIVNTAKAKNTSYTMQEALIEKLSKIGGFGRKWRKRMKEHIDNDFFVDPYYDNGTLFDLTRSDLIGIMLNFGNESNIQKFTEGFVDRKTMPQGLKRREQKDWLSHEAKILEVKLEALIEANASLEDRQFVQEIWDIFKEWKPAINAMYTEIAGIGPKMVESRAIQSRHGKFEGGYFPIFQDYMRGDVADIQGAADINAMFGPNFIRSTTANHYTKERTGHVDVVKFKEITQELGQRMQQVIHDVSYRPALMEINKILQDKVIMAAVRKHYGPEYEVQLRFWAQNIANHFNMAEKEIEWYNSLARGIRMNTIAHVLPGNFRTLFSPAVGLLNVVALTKVLFQRKESVDLAHAKSLEIPHTFRNMNRDMNEKLEGLIQKNQWDAVTQIAVRIGFWPIMKLEQGFRITTFVDEYKKGIAEGLPEDDAITQADSAVRVRHGAHGLPDLVPIQRANEFAKVATMFSGYFITQDNWRRQIPNAVRRGNYIEALKSFYGSTLIGALFGMALYNKDSGDDDDNPYFRWIKNLVKATLLEMAGGTFGARDAANFFLEWQEPKTPLGGLLDTIKLTGQDIKRVYEGKEPKAPIRHAANLAGLVMGAPLGQIGRTAQGIADVRSGRQNPPRNILELFNLVVQGKIEEKKGNRR